MLCLDKSVEFWLDEVRSGYIRIGQVWSSYSG
jgi:hypothetical protein